MGEKVNPLHLALYACKQLGLEEIVGHIPIPRIVETEKPDYISRAVDWLILTQKQNDRFSYWEYDYPLPSYVDYRLWKSGLTEAFGALVLLTVGRTEDARRHLECILTDVKEGGTAYHENDSTWLLEHACPNPPIVLNGMLYCLIILYECMLRLDDAKLKQGFDLGFRTLRRNLKLFDAGFYTYYDSRKNPADTKYHDLHIDLLHRLYRITGDTVILSWVVRWKRYRKLYSLIEPLIFLRLIIRARGSVYL